MTDQNKNSLVRLCRKIESFVSVTGRAIALLNVLLVLVILVQVVLRYAFGRGMVSLEELQWHIYAVCFMMAISFNVVHDAHVRLDLLYCKFSPRAKDWVDLFGLVVFLLPLVVIIFLQSIDFVAMSFRLSESSSSPLGLPFRWAIKGVIPVSMAILGLTVLARSVIIGLRLGGKIDAR